MLIVENPNWQIVVVLLIISTIMYRSIKNKTFKNFCNLCSIIALVLSVYSNWNNEIITCIGLAILHWYLGPFYLIYYGWYYFTHSQQGQGGGNGQGGGKGQQGGQHGGNGQGVGGGGKQGGGNGQHGKGQQGVQQGGVQQEGGKGGGQGKGKGQGQTQPGTDQLRKWRVKYYTKKMIPSSSS